MEFVRFYWDVLWRVPGLLWQSFATADGFISVVIFIAGFVFGSEVVKRLTEWHVSNRRLALYGVGLYFVFLLLQSNYAAFKDMNTANAKAIEKLDDKLDKVARDSDTRGIIVDQLTKENAALAAGGRVLTDAQARIEAIRQQFLDHANKAPTKEQYTPEAAHDWWSVAASMKEGTIDSSSDLSLEYLDDKENTYEQLQRAVGSLRSIAINVTEEDLVDNSPERSY